MLDESRSVREGLIQACKEVRLIREGKLPSKTWREFYDSRHKHDVLPVVDVEHSKQFIEEGNKNRMSDEYLDKCKGTTAMFKHESINKLTEGKIQAIQTLQEALNDVVPVKWS